MRRDIDKVIFERAKAGRTWASKTPRAPEVRLDDGGEQVDEKTNHIRLNRQKGRNSHFNALERFMVRNVGRPWNKVYAEICAAVDGRTTLGAEIREHVQHVLCCRKRGLYVHPKSGLLRRVPE